jgi:hypothetical protein
VSSILPLYDDDSDPILDAGEYFNADDTPRFWVPQCGNSLDEDLAALYWRHLLIDDPAAARGVLHRMATALLAWSAEVATWGGDELQPLWCPGCGEYCGGEPCTTPSCAQHPPMPCCNPVAETCCSGLPKDHVLGEVES